MSKWFVYIVEMRGKLYVVITTDLPNRMRQHAEKMPLYHESQVGKTEALKRERTLKGWTMKKKLDLIANFYSQQ